MITRTGQDVPGAGKSTTQRSPPRWHFPWPQEEVSEEEEDVGRHRKKDKKKKRGKGFIDDAAEEVRGLKGSWRWC